MCSSLKMTTLFFAFVPNIAPKYFKEWCNTLRKFTWEEKKKSRVKLKKLKFSERMWRVGTARSEQLQYFYAVQIKHLMMWMNDTANLKWKGIEMELLKLLSSIIFCRNKKTLIKMANYFVTYTVKIWRRIVNAMNIKEDEMI